jgi:asparagine synthase (glutamine-hydrolysing)
MSGFFGIFRPQGGPVDLEAFEQMKTAMHREGFDGMETHVEDKIAMGHLMLRVSSESKYDKQPLKSSCGNYLLVGHFRLDYRDELGDKLALTQAELALTPDSQLAMLAYQKWKEKCVHHLEGDWAFALYNELTGIFFARDIGGYSALFYVYANNQYYFSTDLNVLVAFGILPVEVDLEQYLRIGISGLECSNGYTLFEGIYHLKSSSLIKICQGSSLEQVAYWELKPRISIRYKFHEDCFQEFFSLIHQAVATRLRDCSRIGIFLSAGLDSTAIAYFSALFLKYKNKTLYTFTSFPQYNDDTYGLEDSRSREDIYVKLFLEYFENVDAKYMDFENFSHAVLLDDNKSIDYYDPLVTNNSFWLEGILKDASQNKVLTMLNGQLGNYTISWDAPKLDLYLLLSGKFFIVLKRLYFVSGLKNFSGIKYFKENFYRPFVFFMKAYFKSLMNSKRDLLINDSLICKSIYDNQNWDIKYTKDELIPNYSLILNPQKLRQKLFKNNSSSIGMKWYGASHRNALNSLDPTSDYRVVGFSFSLDEEWFNQKAISKYLFRKVMVGKLPDAILGQQKTNFQSIDIGLRLINDRDLRGLIDEIEKNPISSKMFGYNSMSQLYKSLSSENPQKTDRINSNKILKSISLNNLIQKFTFN